MRFVSPPALPARGVRLEESGATRDWDQTVVRDDAAIHSLERDVPPANLTPRLSRHCPTADESVVEWMASTGHPIVRKDVNRRRHSRKDTPCPSPRRSGPPPVRASVPSAPKGVRDGRGIATAVARKRLRSRSIQRARHGLPKKSVRVRWTGTRHRRYPEGHGPRHAPPWNGRRPTPVSSAVHRVGERPGSRFVRTALPATGVCRSRRMDGVVPDGGVPGAPRPPPRRANSSGAVRATGTVDAPFPEEEGCPSPVAPDSSLRASTPAVAPPSPFFATLAV
jgi:hypothetical protein